MALIGRVLQNSMFALSFCIREGKFSLNSKEYCLVTTIPRQVNFSEDNLNGRCSSQEVFCDRMGINSLLFQFILYPEKVPNKLITSRIAGILAWGSVTQRRMSSAYREILFRVSLVLQTVYCCMRSNRLSERFDNQGKEHRRQRTTLPCPPVKVKSGRQ